MRKILLIAILLISSTLQETQEIKVELKEKNHTVFDPMNQSLYLGQSIKINTPGGFDAFQLSLHTDVNDMKYPFCYAAQRQVRFENVTYFNVYDGQVESHGLLKNEIPIIVGWTSMKPNSKNTFKGMAALDSNLDLYIFIIDDKVDKDYYGTQLLGRINMQQVYSTEKDFKFIEEEVYLVEARGIIFMFFSDRLLMYNTNSKVSATVPGYTGDKELKKVIAYNFGAVTMFYIAHGTGGFSAYKMNAAPGLQNISVELYLDSDKDNNLGFNFVDINVYEYELPTSTKQFSLSIYALDSNSGIHSFEQIFQEEKIEPNNIFKNSKVLIPYKNGQFFSMYKDETFFIVGSEFGNYIATEIEFNEQSNTYFVNRRHEVDNEIQDILVNDNYAILLGANTHTIIWHSVNSQVIQDLSPYYSKFSLYGYNGGVFFQGPYDENIGKSVDFFAGFQRRHLFVVKIVEQDPYFECVTQNADKSGANLVGSHNVQLSVKAFCPNIKEPNSNYYCSYEQQITIDIKQVYADSDDAGVIAGIVIGVLGSIIITGVVIFCLYKKKAALKSSLQVEISNLLNRKKANEQNQYQQLDKQLQQQQQQGIFESDKINMNRASGQGTYPEINAMKQSYPEFQQDIEQKKASDLQLVNKQFKIDNEKDIESENKDQVINFDDEQ